MKTIIFNRKRLDITEGDMRVLFTLLCSNFAAKKSEFNEGSGNYIKSILPRDRDHWAELGISEVYSPRTAREKLFFKENPRCQSGIFGNKRRINAIFKALNDRISWQVGWDDENIPSFGLEFFEEESEAQQCAESLYDAGETGIVLTKLEEGHSAITWELIDGDWE